MKSALHFPSGSYRTGEEGRGGEKNRQNRNPDRLLREKRRNEKNLGKSLLLLCDKKRKMKNMRHPRIGQHRDGSPKGVTRRRSR